MQFDCSSFSFHVADALHYNWQPLLAVLSAVRFVVRLSPQLRTLQRFP